MKGVVLALLVAAASAAKPTMPTEYSLRATMTMPYYGLVEPIDVWFSEEGGLGRLDYWGGIDRYIYNATGTAYQIVPTSDDGVSSSETCFIAGANFAPTTIFPDLTYFPDEEDEYGDEGCSINGVACRSWTLRSATYNETTGFDGNYTIYVSAEDSTPLRFHNLGFNVILGSHYDEYIFDYMDLVEETPEDSAFTPPAMECEVLETDDGDDGGPTKFLEAKRPKTAVDTPLADLKAMLPGGGAHRAARFEKFVAEHKKEYKSLEEQFHRAALYHASEKYVNAMNRKRLSYWLGVNHMADWTAEEKQHLRGRLHTPKGTVVPATKQHEAKTPKEDMPDEVDWVSAGAVTPPKDQGTCGSCWSYGATGTTEGQVFLATGELTPLSQQNLMDCSWNQGNHACDGGLDFRAYAWMLDQADGGLATERSYPYMNSDGYCRFSSSKVGATISGYANLSGTVDDLNDALVNVGPISVSIDAAADSFYFYQGGLYYDEDCKSGIDDLDHTVLAVGYTTVDGQIYSIVKNSWSDHWGEGGYVRISQKDNCCGVATQPTYTILADTTA